jgi:hypothetical protein
MRNDLRVGLGTKIRSFLFEPVTKLAKIFNDPVVHNGKTIGRMRMRVFFAGLPMGGPARMPNPNCTLKRFFLQSAFEVAELSFRSPACQLSVFQGRHPSGVISAIFQAFERIDEMRRDRFATEYAYNPAHSGLLLL